MERGDLQRKAFRRRHPQPTAHSYLLDSATLVFGGLATIAYAVALAAGAAVVAAVIAGSGLLVCSVVAVRAGEVWGDNTRRYKLRERRAAARPTWLYALVMAQAGLLAVAVFFLNGGAISPTAAAIDHLPSDLVKLTSAVQHLPVTPTPPSGPDQPTLDKAIFGLTKGLNSLTSAVHHLPAAASTPVKPLQAALDRLTKGVNHLTSVVHHLPAAVPTGPYAAHGHVTVPILSGIRWSLVILMLVLLGWGLWQYLSGHVRRGSRLMIAAAVSGVLSGGLSFYGNFRFPVKIPLSMKFSCDNCSLVHQRSSPVMAFHVLGKPSPPFDIGESEIAKRGKEDCINPEQSRKKWDQWLDSTVHQWCTRTDPSLVDSLWIVGSTDRQPLAPRLLQQFGSNTGLARSRAESVQRAFVQQVKRDCPLEAPAPSQIFQITRGPADTLKVSDRSGHTATACSDRGLQADRRVRLWMTSPVVVTLRHAHRAGTYKRGADRKRVDSTQEWRGGGCVDAHVARLTVTGPPHR